MYIYICTLGILPEFLGHTGLHHQRSRKHKIISRKKILAWLALFTIAWPSDCKNLNMVVAMRPCGPLKGAYLGLLKRFLGLA